MVQTISINDIYLMAFLCVKYSPVIKEKPKRPFNAADMYYT